MLVGLRLLQAIYRKKMTTENFLRPQDMSLTETCDHVFLPEGGATTSQNSPYISVLAPRPSLKCHSSNTQHSFVLK